MLCRFLVTPDLNITASERAVGPDVVFAYRSAFCRHSDGTNNILHRL